MLTVAPDHLEALHRLAWSLATCPRKSVRNGPRAVELAERACRATGYGAPPLMDALAAAYAESGRFKQAVDMAGRAASLAERQDGALAEQIRRRLKRYEAHEPYREE